MANYNPIPVKIVLTFAPLLSPNLVTALNFVALHMTE